MTTTTPLHTTDDLPAGRPQFILGLRRPNQYAGTCRVCSMEVAPGAGHITRLRSGSWAVQHGTLDACRIAYAAVRDAGEVRWVPERGEVHVIDAETPGAYGSLDVEGRSVIFVRVSYRQNGSGWYLNRWSGSGWEYAPRLRSRVSAETAATPAHAAAFGAAWSRCVFCTRALDTAESITVGYGPDCAQRRGLPWGTRAASAVASSVAEVGERIATTTVPVDGGFCGCGEEFSTGWEADPLNHDCRLLVTR